MGLKDLQKQELTIDLGAFLRDTKQVIRFPKKFFASYQSKKQSPISDRVIYFALITILGSILGLIYSFVIRPVLTSTFPQSFPAFETQPTIAEAVSVLLIGMVMVVLLSFVWAGILHGWFKLFKAKGTYQDSYTIFAYSRAPLSLFGWIPFIGGLSGLYTLYLMAVGAHNIHGFSMRKSILLIVPIVILVIVLQIVSYAVLMNAS